MLLWQLSKGQEESKTKPVLQSTLLVVLLDRTNLTLGSYASRQTSMFWSLIDQYQELLHGLEEQQEGIDDWKDIQGISAMV